MTATTKAVAESLATGRPLIIIVRPDSNDHWSSLVARADPVAPVLKANAVALDLIAGSQDHSQLAQLVPIGNTPAIIAFARQAVVLKITSEVSPQEFLDQFWQKVMLKQDGTPAQTDSTAETTGPAGHSVATTNDTENNSAPTAPETNETRNIGSEPNDMPASTTPTLSRELPQTLAASSSPAAVQVSSSTPANTAVSNSIYHSGAAPASAASVSASSSGPSSTVLAPEVLSSPIVAQRAQASQAAARDSLASERERIMKLVQADRRETASRSVHPTTTTAQPATAPPQPAQSTTGTDNLSTEHKKCNLAIRCLDSHQLKHSFERHATLVTVREWVVAQGNSDPFLFCQTYPKRTFEAAEETKSLDELGLVPSCNLILKHVPSDAAHAYDQSRQGWGSWLSWLGC